MSSSTRPRRGPFPPAGEIAVGEYRLRPWRAADALPLAAIYARALDVPPSFTPRSSPLTLADARRFLARARRGWRGGMSAHLSSYILPIVDTPAAA